jgi:hypothetical protein
METDCDTFELTGKPLEPFLPPHIRKEDGGTRLTAGSNGKKEKDWVIRSQVPKSAVRLKIR